MVSDSYKDWLKLKNKLIHSPFYNTHHNDEIDEDADGLFQVLSVSLYFHRLSKIVGHYRQTFE